MLTVVWGPFTELVWGSYHVLYLFAQLVATWFS